MGIVGILLFFNALCLTFSPIDMYLICVNRALFILIERRNHGSSSIDS